MGVGGKVLPIPHHEAWKNTLSIPRSHDVFPCDLETRHRQKVSPGEGGGGKGGAAPASQQGRVSGRYCGISSAELTALSWKWGERGDGKREGLLEDDDWEAPLIPSTPFPKKNITALRLLMTSRWSSGVTKHGELSWGRVAHTGRLKAVHAALVCKNKARRKQRTHLCQKGKEELEKNPSSILVRAHPYPIGLHGDATVGFLLFCLLGKHWKDT